MLSDGCIRIGTLNDLDAEWTGGFFDLTGRHFYVSVQHNLSGFGTILDITDWKKSFAAAGGTRLPWPGMPQRFVRTIVAG